MSPPNTSSSKPHVVHLVRLLNYVAQRNAPSSNDVVTAFHRLPTEREPLLPFIERLDQYIRCSESCYATALVFIDRITESNPDLKLNSNTVHRLFTTSLLVANQFLDDTAERALQFANTAGYHPLTMASLKTDFLFRIRFRLVVSEEEVRGYSDKLQGRFSTLSFARSKMWAGKPATPPSPKRTLESSHSGSMSLARSTSRKLVVVTRRANPFKSSSEGVIPRQKSIPEVAKVPQSSTVRTRANHLVSGMAQLGMDSMMLVRNS